VNLTPAEGERIIELVRSRVREVPATPVLPNVAQYFGVQTFARSASSFSRNLETLLAHCKATGMSEHHINAVVVPTIQDRMMDEPTLDWSRLKADLVREWAQS
jgi:hypothetical protein